MAWRWLQEREVMAMHGELIAEHGGSDGVRDQGLLSSALSRPQQKATYEKPSVHDLAAACAFGIMRNHPFIDGNKRSGFVAAAVFLKLNGWELQAPEAEAYAAVLALAQGDMDELAFSKWLKAYAVKKSS